MSFIHLQLRQAVESDNVNTYSTAGCRLWCRCTSPMVYSQGKQTDTQIGMGLFFALAMMGISRLQSRYTSHKTSSAEEFNSASRSVPPGLIAAGIVSAWTWAATLLQSSATAYKFGLSGPWWYASGATIQSMSYNHKKFVRFADGQSSCSL